MKLILLRILLPAVLSFYPVRVYLQLADVQSWENDIRDFEHLDSIETYPDDAILFAGSSSIRLWSTLAQDMAPYSVIQRGYGGAKLSDFANYAERIINPHPCKAIVLFIANDIAGNEFDKSPGEVARLFGEVWTTIRNKHEDTPIFWIAITPTAKRWALWPSIAEANNLIQGACQNMPNTYFIKTDFAFFNANGQPKNELFLADSLHLNAQGYAVWTEMIRKELDRVLLE
jgi:lysophospholipase L1-like esterase